MTKGQALPSTEKLIRAVASGDVTQDVEAVRSAADLFLGEWTDLVPQAL